ncbi:type II toxin-antitoxin system PemK/MazF family toxin [Candidatus Peregrinibacteria bacterium]|jgi:mRNA interferase MazF|nr:type II toxin-antitoxin system PemK/MazF family toxin [Candidatus Peregrinibacteria bacterium]
MKNFSQWNRQKQEIHESDGTVFFHEREIWFAKLGVNVGYEQDGNGKGFLRPVLIIKKFSNNVFWGLPLTKTKKSGKYYFEFEFIKNIKSYAILSQMKLFDVKRLQYLAGHINKEDYAKVKKSLKQFIE